MNGEDCPFCFSEHNPAVYETCQHHVGWRSEGDLELAEDIEPLKSLLLELVEVDEGAFLELAVESVVRAGELAFDENTLALVQDFRRSQSVDGALERLDCQWARGLHPTLKPSGARVRLFSRDKSKIMKTIRGLRALKNSVSFTNEDRGAAADGWRRPRAGVARTPRVVLIVAEDWPSGTMAFALGDALFSSLGVDKADIKLIEQGPPRVFRVMDPVDEPIFWTEFLDRRERLGVSWHGRILYCPKQ